jgi:hypothetical protein
MKPRVAYALLSAFVVAADQLTKWLVRTHLDLHEYREVVSGLLSLSHVRNRGAAFGILSMQKRVGSAKDLNRQSVINRDTVEEWVQRHPLFELAQIRFFQAGTELRKGKMAILPLSCSQAQMQAYFPPNRHGSQTRAFVAHV